MMLIEIEEHLPLANRIAREFANIPGVGAAEIEMRAQEALAAAARGFDPARGEFAPYAATAVRNVLRSLYDAQVRHHAHHAYHLDDSRAGGDSTAGRPVCKISLTRRDNLSQRRRGLGKPVRYFDRPWISLPRAADSYWSASLRVTTGSCSTRLLRDLPAR